MVLSVLRGFTKAKGKSASEGVRGTSEQQEPVCKQPHSSSLNVRSTSWSVQLKSRHPDTSFGWLLLKNVSAARKRCCHHASCQVMTAAWFLPDMTFGIRPGSDQTPVLLTEAWLLSFSKERWWSFVRVNIGFMVTLSSFLRVLVVPNCFNFWRMASIPFPRSVPKYSPVSEVLGLHGLVLQHALSTHVLSAGGLQSACFDSWWWVSWQRLYGYIQFLHVCNLFRLDILHIDWWASSIGDANYYKYAKHFIWAQCVGFKPVQSPVLREEL